MKKIVVTGAGWAGVSAAISGKKAGADVVLIEKTDLLLGAGNVGGIFRNNGRYTATEEMKAMGAGELFDFMDQCAVHKNISFPGHQHASLYDVSAIEPVVENFVCQMGIEVKKESHVMDVGFHDGRISSVILNDGTIIDGDAFVDATGSSGPMGNCLKYGHGCSMCIQRCPTYGPRVSLSARCGVKDLVAIREDGTPGVFSGACKINKDTLSEEVRNILNRDGVVVLKVPDEDIDYDKLNKKACKQYALKEYSENIILLDTGSAKLMTCYYPLDKLRKIPGLEKAEYTDPYSGGKGNSIRFLSIAPCSETMQVDTIDNLFCGGEKAFPLIGHTEAIVSGALAGHNAARLIAGRDLLVFPDCTATGNIISYARKNFVQEKKYKERYTFAGGIFFGIMKNLNLYSVNPEEIQNRIKHCQFNEIFNERILV